MTPTQSDEELSKKAILWVKANAPDLDIDCYAQEVTETEDGDLCIDCRHIFWAAVRGYIAGQQELEAVKKKAYVLNGEIALGRLTQKNCWIDFCNFISLVMKQSKQAQGGE